MEKDYKKSPVDVNHIIKPQNYNYKWTDDGNTWFKFIWDETRIKMIRPNKTIMTTFYDVSNRIIKQIDSKGTLITEYFHTSNSISRQIRSLTNLKDYAVSRNTRYRVDEYEGGAQEVCVYNGTGSLTNYWYCGPGHNIEHVIAYQYYRFTGREISYTHQDEFFHTWEHTWEYRDDGIITCYMQVTGPNPYKKLLHFTPEGTVLLNECVTEFK